MLNKFDSGTFLPPARVVFDATVAGYQRFGATPAQIGVAAPGCCALPADMKGAGPAPAGEHTDIDTTCTG